MLLHEADEYSIVSCCCVLHALRARGPREIFFTRARAPTRTRWRPQLIDAKECGVSSLCAVSVPVLQQNTYRNGCRCHPGISTIYTYIVLISKQSHACLIQSHSFQPPTYYLFFFLYKVQLHITACLPNCILTVYFFYTTILLIFVNLSTVLRIIWYQTTDSLT